MSIKIRFATMSDFEKYRSFDPHSSYIDPEKIKTKISAHEIIIGTNNDDIVALVRINFLWSTRPYLEFIYVEEKYRGNGYSSQMLEFTTNYLIENKYSYLISSAESENPDAQKWHIKNGFTDIGTLKNLNLPHDNTDETFFIKKISDLKSLRTYPIFGSIDQSFPSTSDIS